MNTHRSTATPLGSHQVGPVDQVLAEASRDPRVRLRPPTTVEEALTALRAAMELRQRRALPAAPRRPELPPGPPRQVVFVLDEAAILIGQPRSGKQSPEAAHLIREILAADRTSRINDGRHRLPEQ
ncbi:hypothetical protein P3T27_006619 [Kitasatospora sp. MAA19]|uniref:hypothetical protein n=1 Tax=Kitasatospora sp. MAA19 TaxID=3035090 RepID=UPI0024760505|nr:hypothetical protein [Kitasatospora sp. MAA19]MDH6709870.1 hypothetical protein [Kitasatospora sp. MAA19]